MKTSVEDWFENNIAIEYREALADTVFCNDRKYEIDSAGGTNYDVSKRLSEKPTFKCSQVLDRFTTSKSVGNANLKYPVGLITADEVVTAGGGKRGSTNNNYYLYKGNSYFTMSPKDTMTNGESTMFTVYSGLSSVSVIGAIRVAPVINLTQDYTLSLIGDGTMTNPFRETGVNP